MAYRAQGGSVPKKTLAVSRFKGVDLAGNPTAKSPARADWAINMVTDNNGYPQTRHGYEEIPLTFEGGGRINGIHRLETTAGTKTFIHHGANLSLWENGTATRVASNMADNRSVSTQLDNKLLILDGKRARVYADWSSSSTPSWSLQYADQKGYVPTVVISAKPGSTPGGTPYEGVNLASSYQYNQFIVTADLPDTEDNRTLKLSDGGVVQNSVTVEKRNAAGEWAAVVSGWSVTDYTNGIITFTSALTPTTVTGQDNYRVKFASDHSFSESVSQNYRFTTGLSSTSYQMVCLCYLTSAGASSTMVAVPRDQATQEDVYNVTYNGPTDASAGLVNGAQYHMVDSGTYGQLYRIPLDYSDVATNETFGLRVDTCATKSSIGAATLLDTYELTGLSSSFPAANSGDNVDGKRRIYHDNNTGDVFLWYRLVQDGGNYTLEVVTAGAYYTYDGSGSTGPRRRYGMELGRGAVNYKKSGGSYADRLNQCTILMKYGYGGTGDRVFISGNAELPSTDCWSEINNPLYFPDQNYARVGDETTPIMGYSWLSDGSLAIHKGWNGQDSSVYYRESTTYNGEATFTLRQGAIGWGVVSKWAGAYLQGEPLQLSEQGVFATVPTYNLAINDRYAQDRSYFINPLLIQQNLSEAVGISFKNKYYLSAGDYVFVADGGQQSYSYKGDKRSYEWYVWDNVPARIWWTDGDDLYFGTEDGKVYMFNDGYEDAGEPIKWESATPWLDFGTLVYYKKVKNVAVLAAPDLWQNPHVEYRFPLKQGKVKHLLQISEQEAPWLKTTNYKAKKISLMQVHIFGAKPCGLSAINILYSISGKIKG